MIEKMIDSISELKNPEEMEKAADGTVYKVGIVQFVDDASLNQINRALCAELNAKGAELGVTFDYEDYNLNGQADATMLGHSAAAVIRGCGCYRAHCYAGGGDHAGGSGGQ